MKKLPKRREGLRILWVHTLPYWQESLCRIFDYNDRVEIAVCDMDIDIDIDAPEDLTWTDPYRTMAEYLIRNWYNGPSQRRVGRTLEYAEKMKADGIIYFCHWGCKQSSGGSVLLKEEMQNKGIPMLILDGDGIDKRNSHDGQIKTRLEAFLEMLDTEKEEETL